MGARTTVCVFQREGDLIAATAAARSEGITIVDAYTPYAVHGLDAAMGLRASRLPIACFALGVLGVMSILGFQYWASTRSWAHNVGGRPWNSWPAFIPVTFEVLVLFAGLGGVIAFFVVSGLRPWRREALPAGGVTDDRFALVLRPESARHDRTAIDTLMRRFHPVAVEEREA